MLIKQTQYWNINHRINSALPGYIMLSYVGQQKQLHHLPIEAKLEMVELMSNIEQALITLLTPEYLYIGRYGHSQDLAIHFHFIPVSQWVIDLFWQDERYRKLQNFGKDELKMLTDGAELTFFIWREFCESPSPPIYQGMSREEVIKNLRLKLA